MERPASHVSLDFRVSLPICCASIMSHSPSLGCLLGEAWWIANKDEEHAD